ncbi:MAG TPA: metallophosphoesterase family protein [Nitrospira sp.]|nr:metallophosphoesterase family protein [Nitrospira sp.]
MANRSTVNRSLDALTKRRTLRIGVITDTHGVYDPAIDRHFAGVAEILHAGDIGDRAVIRRLRRLAPVTAVSGNIDRYEASGFPRRRLVQRAGLKIALCHVLYEKGKMTAEAEAWLDRVRPDVCVFGHSHLPTVGRHGRTILFNPGSAGPKRFSLPRGIGMLTVARRKTLARVIRLGDRVAPSSPTVSARANVPAGAPSAQKSARGKGLGQPKRGQQRR